MGAVRKLATVVIVGLVALSTLMVVYLAAEPNRRESETTEQGTTQLVRGTELYITYCLQCHGPAGLGYAAQDGRIGAPLNQDAVFSEEEQADMNANFQSDDPVERAIAEDWIRFRIAYGVPPEPIADAKVMPAFANDLNVEEVNALVYLIMYGDWNYVYNTIVRETGIESAEEECLENPEAEYCEDTSLAPPAYPAAPAGAASDEEGESQEEEGEDPEAADEESSAAVPADEAAGEAAVSIEAQDIAFSTSEITVNPGDTIEMTNTGQLPHDFTVDVLGIQEVTPTNGDTVTITIPDDAEPGDFEYYCSVPGHKQAGMVGTLIIEAP